MVKPASGSDIGDGVERHVQYGVWRTDKQADPGFSKELVHCDIPEDCYDNLDNLPILNTSFNSINDVFLQQCRDRPNSRLFGTRKVNSDGSFGAYEWQTYGDVFVIYEEIAKGCKDLQLLEPVPGINEDGKSWAFCGIWSKNRWEWHTTMMSANAC